MKKQIILALIIIITLTLNFQGNPTSINIPIIKLDAQNIDDFIPDQWKLLKKASGDLNNDGLIDIACIIELIKDYSPGSEGAPPRILFIAFKNKNGSYKLTEQTYQAVLKADEGGIWGDPLHDLKISDGSVVLNFYGGSNFRWAYEYKFKYYNRQWKLINVIINNYHTGTGDGSIEEYNLITGKLIKSITKAEEVIKKEIINRGIKKLVNLREFIASASTDLVQY